MSKSKTKIARAPMGEASQENGAATKAKRTKLFPAASFEESLTLATAIQKHAPGQKVRRLTLFDQMKKSPDSGPSRQLVTNSGKYGLTKGSYAAEHLELTPEGKIATGIDVAERDKARVRFQLAIERIPIFKDLHEELKGNRLPAPSILEDMAKDKGVPEKDAKECVEMFIVNAKFVGVLKIISGGERIVPIEQVLEELPETPTHKPAEPVKSLENVDQNRTGTAKTDIQSWDNVCFYISPIGEEDTESRKHADLFLGSIVEPSLEEFGLKVIRADKIGKPGMITSQIIEHILKAKLVIADLSYHNPNVFYELCLRHVCRLPTVQIIRKADKIPFDLEQYRTIPIDTTDIYTMVPNLQSYKALIATQVRTALKNPDSADNPVSTFYPNLKITY